MRARLLKRASVLQITHTSIPWKVAVAALRAGVVAEESRATG
jgi:hypothetical protein